MSTYLSPLNIPINSYLFEAKKNELKQLVGNLKIDEVKDDERFKRTIQRIKGNILLKPVTFQEPKITGNSTDERIVSSNFQDMWGGKKQINVITIEFKFDGSSELFNYGPNGLSFGSSGNNRIYQPGYGNSIDVQIELQTLDKIIALDSAKAQMELTFSVITGNNEQAKQFNVSIEPIIEQMLIAKRKELIDLYS